MRVDLMKEVIELPEKVSAEVTGSTLKVKGEKGDVQKNLPSTQIKIEKEGNNIVLSAKNATRRQKKVMGAFKAHIKNMIKGASQGHIYKLRICSGHFPMTASINDQEIAIKNFLGEKIPRRLKIKPGVKVEVIGTEIVLTGTDKSVVSQVAADIEKLTRRPGFDTRIFQDGCYITYKDGKEIK